MNALTLRELELRRAQLSERAERLRQEGRAVPVLSARAAPLAREAKALQERADDLTALLRVAEGMA